MLRAVVADGRCTCSREARRDVRVLDDYLAAHPALCDRRRAEIAAVDDPWALAELWTDGARPGVPPGELDAVGGHPASGASFVTTRKRLQQLVGRRAAPTRSPPGWAADGRPAGQPGPARRAGPAGPRRDRPGRPSTGATGTAGRTSSRSRCPGRPRTRTGSTAQLRPAPSRPESGYAELLAAQQQKQAGDEAWAELGAPASAAGQGCCTGSSAVWAEIARDREHARSEVIRYFWVLRAYVLRAGELTGLGDDIFFLDADRDRPGAAAATTIGPRRDRRAAQGVRRLRRAAAATRA